MKWALHLTEINVCFRFIFLVSNYFFTNIFYFLEGQQNQQNQQPSNYKQQSNWVNKGGNKGNKNQSKFLSLKPVLN